MAKRMTNEEKAAHYQRLGALEADVKTTRFALDGKLKELGAAAKDSTNNEGFDNVVAAVIEARGAFVAAKAALAEARA